MPKKILIVRDGAVGDAIMVTPLVRSWADRGYDVHVACKRDVGAAVFAFNPHVKSLHELGPQKDLGARRDRINKIKDRLKPDLCVDLMGCCENEFLFHSCRPEYNLPLSFRRSNASGKNYYEHACVTLGGGDRTDPELYTSAQEDATFARFRAFHLGWKVVQIQITGSSINKCYPWWPIVIRELHRLYPRMMVITTGDPAVGRLIEMGAVEAGADPKRIWATCGDKRYTLRDSLVTTKYVDLVIGPETGVMNAAACFDTPKIPLLTHSSIDNLCRGWRNCYPIQGKAACSPCYLIVSMGDECDMVTEEENPMVAGATRCLANIEPELILSHAKMALEAGRCLQPGTSTAIPKSGSAAAHIAERRESSATSCTNFPAS